jgi:hypothetical protein
VLYTVIDKTLKLSQLIYGDKTEVVVSRLWDRMQEQLKKASATLLGWYHSHPGREDSHRARRRDTRKVLHRAMARGDPRRGRSGRRDGPILPRSAKRRLAQDAGCVLRAVTARLDQTGWQKALVHHLEELQGIRADINRSEARQACAAAAAAAAPAEGRGA